MSDNISKVFL